MFQRTVSDDKSCKEKTLLVKFHYCCSQHSQVLLAQSRDWHGPKDSLSVCRRAGSMQDRRLRHRWTWEMWPGTVFAEAPAASVGHHRALEWCAHTCHIQPPYEQQHSSPRAAVKWLTLWIRTGQCWNSRHNLWKMRRPVCTEHRRSMTAEWCVSDGTGKSCFTNVRNIWFQHRFAVRSQTLGSGKMLWSSITSRIGLTFTDCWHVLSQMNSVMITAPVLSFSQHTADLTSKLDVVTVGLKYMQPARQATATAIDRYLLTAPELSSNPPGAVAAVSWWDRQTYG